MPRVYEKKPMLGRRFGRWTVIGAGPGWAWRCRCDCGQERAVLGASLRAGRSASCGCLNVEMARERRIAWNKRRPPRALKNLVGQLFGRLSVLEYLGGKKLRWRCECVCGKEAIVPRASLMSGDARSCGCLKRQVNAERNKARALPVEEARARAAARRANEQAARRAVFMVGKVSAADWRAVLAAWENRCAYCQRSAKMTQDHLIPLARGGRHEPRNIVPACLSCNATKHALPLEQALARLQVEPAAFYARLSSAQGDQYAA